MALSISDSSTDDLTASSSTSKPKQRVRTRAERTAFPKPKKGYDKKLGEYVIKSIQDFRITPKSVKIPMVYFLCEWEGYKMEESTWEPWGNLAHAQDMAKDFLKAKGLVIELSTDAEDNECAVLKGRAAGSSTSDAAAASTSGAPDPDGASDVENGEES